jgi:hypothetical protein
VDRSLLRLCLVLPLLTSCALCEQLTADRVVVGTVLHVPELVDPTRNPPETRPERTEAAVFFGEIVDEHSDPRPVGGATVRLIHPMAPEGVGLVEDPDDPGNYELSSETDPRLVYLPDQEYRLEVEEGGERYVMRVTLPPEGHDRVKLDSQEVVPHERNTPLELAHPDPSRLAFLAVSRGPDPATGCASAVKKKVYTTVPKKGSEVLDLIDDDDFWHRDPLVVPGEKFAECGLYSVVVSLVERGFPESTNLFLGSQLFAGWAGGELVRVR